MIRPATQRTLLGFAMAAVIAGVPARAQTPSAGEALIAERMSATAGRLAAELGRVRAYLALHDEMLRLDVAAGRCSASEAEARLRQQAEAIFNNSYDDAEWDALARSHAAAAGAYFGELAGRIAAARQWPPGRDAEEFRALAASRLAALRAEYADRIRTRRPTLPVFERAGELAAWTQGRPAGDGAPFAGQTERIAAALPTERCRRMLLASHQPAVWPGKSGETADRPALPPATGLSPAGDPPEYREGMELYERGDTAGARAAFDRALQRQPRHTGSLAFRAHARFWMNDLAGAREDYRAAAALLPDDLGLRRLWAMTEICLGNVLEGREVADGVLRRAPADASALLLAGQAAMSAGEGDLARSRFAEAQQRFQGSLAAQVFQDADQALTRGVPALAAVLFGSVIWMDPSAPQPRFGYAEAMSRLGHAEKAIEGFRFYLQHDDTQSPQAEYARRKIAELQIRR
jgi:Tfp pilus assembly protein PilF